MKKRLVLGVILVFSLTSCSWFHFAVLRPRKPQVKVLENQNNGREIVFIPMIHVNEPGFFIAVEATVDSLRSNGYEIFYEGVGFAQKHDSLTQDTLLRKLRKIVGVQIGDYFKEKNKTTPTYLKRDKFMYQSYENTGVIPEKDHLVDLSVEEIIAKTEQKYGPITLTSCDYQTDHFQEYDCETTGTIFYSINTVRNEYITRKVLNSSSDKIVMIYGSAHWWFIWPELRDAGFKLIKGKMGVNRFY